MPTWPLPPLPARVAAAREVPLVGRRRELTTMEEVWTEVERGRRQLVFVGGEPGAGKSRLVAEVAGALHDEGVAVLVGTSARETGVPYQPFAELLDQLFESCSTGSLDALLDPHSAQLRRLSTKVDRHLPDLQEFAIGVGEHRHDLFEAVSGLLARLAEQRPLALVLEDLHWAQLPTVALLEHVIRVLTDVPIVVLVTLRTTLPDRADELTMRVAELHRLEGVRRLDLGGLDTQAVIHYLVLHGGLTEREARAPAVLLRDRTGGNPFFLRELWADLQHRGGVSALRSSQRVPVSISDSLQERISRLEDRLRPVLELAAVLGDEFDLSTLVAASETDRVTTMGFVDAAVALGLVELVDSPGAQYCFVHALARQAVLDRTSPSRLALLHARAGEALERLPQHNALVPRLAHHFLAAQFLGFHDQAFRHTREAGRLAERSLAFEEAAAWFERAAALPECDPEDRSQLLLLAATDHVRACGFPRARAIYEELSLTGGPEVRLAAAMGFEDATWRPGVNGIRAADLLSAAVGAGNVDAHDAPRVRALGSLSRALALAGEMSEASRVGSRAIDLARQGGDDQTVAHVLTTSLWHGTTPDLAGQQLERSAEISRLSRAARDYETLGAALNFRATASYVLGRPDELRAAMDDARSAVEHTGLPYYRFIFCGHSHAAAFLRGDFAGAERWAQESLKYTETFGDEVAEGPYSVQMFMVRRETGALESFGSFLDGTETFTARWVPGLLALYTEVGQETGMRRALRHLLDRDLTSRSHEAQWPMELVFLTDAALALRDVESARRLQPLLMTYRGMNLVSGTMVATFGSADRYLGRVAALLGDTEAAERHLDAALEMDRRMHSVVHTAETLGQMSLLAAVTGRYERAEACAREALDLAESSGQRRVSRMLAMVPRDRSERLTEREVDVLGLLAAGLSNQQIGTRLHISANTAANHVRSILIKTGTANRTQAAIYAAQHGLV